MHVSAEMQYNRMAWKSSRWLIGTYTCSAYYYIIVWEPKANLSDDIYLWIQMTTLLFS
jgi:hypothetical protein